MNNATRALLVAAIAVGLAACTKKTVPTEPTVTPSTPTTPAVVDDGKYGPEDLDTDACLRQRTVYSSSPATPSTCRTVRSRA